VGKGGWIGVGVGVAVGTGVFVGGRGVDVAGGAAAMTVTCGSPGAEAELVALPPHAARATSPIRSRTQSLMRWKMLESSEKKLFGR